MILYDFHKIDNDLDVCLDEFWMVAIAYIIKCYAIYRKSRNSKFIEILQFFVVIVNFFIKLDIFINKNAHSISVFLWKLFQLEKLWVLNITEINCITALNCRLKLLKTLTALHVKCIRWAILHKFNILIMFFSQIFSSNALAIISADFLLWWKTC